MFRSLLIPLVAGAFVLGLSAASQDPKDESPTSQPTSKPTEEKKRPFDLMIGDPAPAIHADEWLTGDALQLEKGKIYFVYFWATWSAPSIGDFKPLSELHDKYADKDFAVIGFTSEDERGNRLFSVKKTIEEHAENISYPLAWDSKGVTLDRYMTASGHRNLPHGYLIDKSGRIAFLGHPGAIGDTLDALLAGTFDIDAAAKEYADMVNEALTRRELEGRISDGYREGRLGDVILALDELIALGPKYKHYAVNKFRLLLKDLKDPDSAYAWALEAAESCLADDDNMLNTLAYSIVIRGDFEPKNYDVAMKLAQRAVKVSKGKNGQAWNTVGVIHFTLGKYQEAVDAMEKAVEFALSEPQKKSYKSALGTYRKKLSQTK